MKITRHPVDLQRITTVFQSDLDYLNEYLDRVRQQPTGLYSFFLVAETVYQAGSVLAPDSSEVARALTLAAQGGTALYIFQEIEDPPRSFVLGEGPPVTYTKPAGRSCASFPTWMRVFRLCQITRERQLADEVCQVSNEIFRHSEIVGAATEDYSFADLLRAVWTQEHFTRDPAFIRLEAECRQWASGPTRGAPYVRLITLPYLQTLRELEHRDEAGFAAALTEALQGHKKFWSSEKYRQEFSGFVSLELTAVAAMAWDWGMRFEVESDYLPMSWVRGDHYRKKRNGDSVL